MKIALLIHSRFIPAWKIRLAEKLSALAGMDLVFLLQEKQSASSRALDLYLSIERRLLRNIPERNIIDLRESLPHVPVLSVGDASALDVVIAFESNAPNIPARLGVWTWNDVSLYAGFREVLNRSPLTRCDLTAQFSDGRRKVLRRAVFTTDPLSAARNRNRVYLKAASTLLWVLKKISMQDEHEFFSQLEDAGQPVKPNPLRPMELAALMFNLAARIVEKKFRPVETWLVFADPSVDLIPADVSARVKLIAPPGMYWADPMAVEREGRVYLFVEEYVRDERKGRIACLTLDEHARVTDHRTVLNRPYHLSYPFIFEWNGETYMIPETASRRAIELYRCIEFPHRWEFAREIMRDVYAVDTTLLNHNGTWWLFANVMTEEGASSWDELYLFYADTPLAEHWSPHPLNPILSDARLARPAGGFFFHQGTLFRPSQDSSLRYGYALNLNRVGVLSKTDYRETSMHKWVPRAGFLALHTYTRAGGWIFTDSVTRDPKELK